MRSWWMGSTGTPRQGIGMHRSAFLLLRWYFRIVIWARFLWQVSRLDLHLVPTHPGRAAGLGFLGGSAAAFMPLLLSQGVLLAGQIANHIFYEGKTLLDFKPEIVAVTLFLLIVVLGSLCVFAPRLAQAKRLGFLEYGALASRYVEGFDQKWLRGGAPLDEQLVGTGDIQSLTDLAALKWLTVCDRFRSARLLCCKPLSRRWCLCCH